MADGYDLIGPEIQHIAPPPCPVVHAVDAPSMAPPTPCAPTPRLPAPRPPILAHVPPTPRLPPTRTRRAKESNREAESEATTKTSKKERESEMATVKTEKSTTSTISTLKKDKKKRRMLNTGNGTGAHQRPNSYDTLVLSVMCVILIIAIAISIPILLTAFEVSEIDSIKNLLEGIEETKNDS